MHDLPPSSPAGSPGGVPAPLPGALQPFKARAPLLAPVAGLPLPFRVLTWNIRWGGENRIGAIAEVLTGHAADVLVITEYKPGPMGIAMELALRAGGWVYQACSGPVERELGVLIASRHPFTRVSPLLAGGLSPCHLLQVEVAGVTVVGLYLPWDGRKVPYLDALVAFASLRKDLPTLLIGDFNSGSALIDGTGEAMRGAPYLQTLISLGYVDPWRRDNPEALEFTWFTDTGIGKRLDHALLSPGLLPHRAKGFHDHVPRLAGISDHSILGVDLL